MTDIRHLIINLTLAPSFRLWHAIFPCEFGSSDGTLVHVCVLIDSGVIESAHRTVIQKRMKLSGQRWSTKGAKICFDYGSFP